MKRQVPSVAFKTIKNVNRPCNAARVMKSIKRNLAFLIMLVLGGSLGAQSSFPTAEDHQVWEYVIWNFWGGDCQLSFIQTGEEVDVCGHIYTEIYDCYSDINDCNLIGYYRVEGDSVLIRDLEYVWNGSQWEFVVDCELDERLMYDFSARIGDTLVCGINYPVDTTDFWKIDETIISYAGIQRRVLQMKFRPYPNIPTAVYNMRWIKNIGSNIHPFYSLSCIGDHCEQEQQLIRVTKNEDVIYLDTVLTFSFPCNNWQTAIEQPEIREEDIIIYPNPTSGMVHIELSTDQKITNIKIYDLWAQEVPFEYFDQNKNELSLNGLTAGTYYVLISLNEQFFIKKIIKSD